MASKRKCSEYDIQRAVQAYKSDNRTTYAELARIFNVPQTTLFRRIKGQQARQGMRSQWHKLSITEEETII